ncbi:hypothetical protein [Serratia sp. 1D1416]|uniref:hypothetical protein n=1 Tax=Serratia sp. 1D1416 TaxID=2447890 RepID=UPI001013C8B9|nr:hypothetical protein [Serratia sp. 1D1416]
MNNTTTNNKTSKSLTLINREDLVDAQRTIKDSPTSWVWKLCMHKVKRAYGIMCKEPVPEIGEKNGNYICCYSDKETGSYAFVHKRIVEKHGMPECGVMMQGVVHVE